MSPETVQGEEQVRSAELVAALCVTTDLGMGFPLEHGLHTTLIASRLADRLGVEQATASQTYYGCLLSHAGCTTDAHVTAGIFGDSLTTHSKEDAMTNQTTDESATGKAGSEAQTFAYDIAEAIAPSWERRRDEIEEVSTPVREWMVRELGPSEGETLLELAAGVGDTGFEAAAALGERGTLISSDFSPTMLEAARRRGAERGIENVEYRVIDAERIELGDDSVDGVLCRFGYMLMSDPAAALSETRRVLRPGGRLTLAVWGDPTRNPFFTIAAISLVQGGHVPPPEPPPAPGIFSMGSPERTTELLRGAGFGEVRTEEVPVRFPVAGVDEYLAFVADTAGPLGIAVRGLSDAERTAVKADVEDSFGRFAVGDGYELPGVALCASAS